MSGAGARFGSLDGAALVVTTVVGAGIFTVPAYVASLTGGAGMTLGLWLAGGLLALAGALSYAELAARLPRGGAEYVYLREAFGETPAFLSGWTSFVAGFSGAIAAAAVGFATYAGDVVPALARFPTATLAIGPVDVTVSATTFVALGLIALFTTISIAGVRASRVATNALALLIVSGVIALVAATFVGASAPGQALSRSASPGLGAWSALVPIFFTYSGWNAAAYVAGEFRDPSRSIPRALIAGTLIVTLLYVALNAALLRTLSAGGLAAAAAPVSSAAHWAMGTAGGTAVAVLVLVALASSVCAMVITGPRIYAEMARDGVLPAFFARSSHTGRAPAAAAVTQSVWSGLLVLTGTFGQIVTYTGFAIVVFSGVAVCALFVLRRRLGAPATFRVPGFPVIPLLFVASCAVIAAASIRYAPGPSLVGVALILAGVPVRAVARRRSGSAQSRSASPHSIVINGRSGTAFRDDPLHPHDGPGTA